MRGWLHEPEAASGRGLVVTHGAGSNCESPLLRAVAEAFAGAGYYVLRCDLPYRQLRAKGPPFPGMGVRDREGLRRAVEAMREIAAGRVILGGHSYGGRQASMLAAELPRGDSALADALLLLSYPLHPPRKPEQLRTGHFSQLRTPALFRSRNARSFRLDRGDARSAARDSGSQQLDRMRQTGPPIEPRDGPGYTARGRVLRERLARVEERIQSAVKRAGRQRSDVTVIAVTKKFPAEVICQAYELGLRYFGENYVQEFEAKLPALAGLTSAEFHLIGHLQSNKASDAARLFHAVETVDSEKLARRLDQTGRALEVMIELKLSEEGTKAGAAPEALPGLVEAIRACPNLRLTGLMTMPPWSDDSEQTRPYFRHLAALARTCGLAKLSMGMSHDFEAAIEEGATHIRVGTALFGPRKKDG